MVNLIAKVERDALDLNSWERAIVWAAISLRASISHPTVIESTPNYPYANNVRIALGRSLQDEALTATLSIEATLPYQQSYGINSAGNFTGFLKEFYTGNALDYTATACSLLAGQSKLTTDDGTGLPTEPSDVNTLEKYFLWVCWQAEKSLLDPVPARLLPISVDFFEESTPDPTIKIKASIPINYRYYRDNENLICSVLPLASSISPAGLRSIQWEEVTGKPNFSDVAISGDYDDLTNVPSIPASLGDLNDGSQVVKSVNSTEPDPATGNVDITINVGAVEWINVNNKPAFSTVATTGDFFDLVNIPTIFPTNWASITNKPNFSAVATSGSYTDLTDIPNTVATDWVSITDKPTFSSVAFSGDYNDLLNKPNISTGNNGGSGSALVGKKIVIPSSGENLPYNFDFDKNGIINWIGTNEGIQEYNNPIESGEIILTGTPGSLSTLGSIVDQSLTTALGISYSKIIVLEFVNYNISLSKVCLFFNLNNSGTAIVVLEGSNDNSNWTYLGEVEMSNVTQTWYHIDISAGMFYKYIRFRVDSETGSASAIIYRELELYGDVASNSLANGSQNYQLTLSDINYFIDPDPLIGSFYLPSLNTTGLNIGDFYWLYNPNDFLIELTAFTGDQLIYMNDPVYVPPSEVLEVYKISETEWLIK